MAGALEGIKVIDLSRILAGPWASQMLADFGAQVIKIERPNKGDDTRYWGPPFIKEKTSTQPPQAAYFHSTNRNKQSIAIDIQHKTGQQIIKDLVKNADVFIENFKVGALARYGLDYPKMIGLLVEAHKDQQKLINNQQEKIDKLEEMLYNIMNKMENK